MAFLPLQSPLVMFVPEWEPVHQLLVDELPPQFSLQFGVELRVAVLLLHRPCESLLHLFLG